jgi:hypothetical protein
MGSTELLGALQRAKQALLENSATAGVLIRTTLDRVEAATPGGAPLHAQLDNVRKWLDALDRPEDHGRFGGANHLRQHVLTQLRLALGALQDYQRKVH